MTYLSASSRSTPRFFPISCSSAPPRFFRPLWHLLSSPGSSWSHALQLLPSTSTDRPPLAAVGFAFPPRRTGMGPVPRGRQPQAREARAPIGYKRNANYTKRRPSTAPERREHERREDAEQRTAGGAPGAHPVFFVASFFFCGGLLSGPEPAPLLHLFRVRVFSSEGRHVVFWVCVCVFPRSVLPALLDLESVGRSRPFRCYSAILCHGVLYPN